MPDAISTETLPGWPHEDIEAEEVTLRVCLLGQHDERELTGPFGHAMLSWEALRHDERLLELLTKLRNPPYNDDQEDKSFSTVFKNDPDFSTVFPDNIGFIVFPPGFPFLPDKPFPPWFPDTPFLSLKAEYQKELVFRPGLPALESGNIEILDEIGVFERLEQLVTLAKEGRQHKKPGERFKQAAILKRENLNPGESVYDAVFTIRAHMGVEAVRKAFNTWLKDNSELFTEVDTITRRQWEDPRPILRDLAVLRLVKLYGYPGARAWTKEHRPHKGLGAHKSDYAKYVGERGIPGNSPLYDTNEKCRNAVKRALKAIHALRTPVP
jgi:hypothetical protein